MQPAKLLAAHNAADIAYLTETPSHDPAIDAINEEAFGPGRFVRAAYRIREGGPHDRALSFVAMRGADVVGSVRMTPIAAGEGRAHLLGPLAVRPAHKNLGIGRHLVKMAVEAARRAGSGLVLLVGDEPYYGPLGFSRVPYGPVTMPRPVDPRRFLGYELRPGSVAAMTGEIGHVAQIRHQALSQTQAA